VLQVGAEVVGGPHPPEAAEEAAGHHLVVEAEEQGVHPSS